MQRVRRKHTLMLSLSGIGMQTLLKNPLSSPFTLGISHGAAFGASAAILLTVSKNDYAVVDQTIRQMGLSPLALRPVSDLSGGEVQKVMLARALAQSPAILLLDEPTSNLDLKNQMAVMALIRSVVCIRGLMAIVAIHDLNLAVRFADHFLFIKDHRIHAIAKKEELSTEMIEQVYGVEVVIQKVGGHRVVVPV
jgi:iron complex transport system ATP-binding protein